MPNTYFELNIWEQWRLCKRMGNLNSAFKKADSQGEHPPPLQKIWEMDTKGVDRKKVSVSAPNPPKLCLWIQLKSVDSLSRLFPHIPMFWIQAQNYSEKADDKDQRPNLKTFIVVEILFLGTDSFRGINSAMELVPRKNNSLVWNSDLLLFFK